MTPVFLDFDLVKKTWSVALVSWFVLQIRQIGEIGFFGIQRISSKIFSGYGGIEHLKLIKFNGLSQDHPNDE